MFTTSMASAMTTESKTSIYAETPGTMQESKRHIARFCRN